MFGTVPQCTISSCMVHWDGMDKRDSASVWDSPMVYHLGPCDILEWDGMDKRVWPHVPSCLMVQWNGMMLR